MQVLVMRDLGLLGAGMANAPKDDCDEDLGERPEEVAKRYIEERGLAEKEEQE